MKINTNYKLREVAGETIVVNQGKAGADMTRIISLNASAKLLYERLQGCEFGVEDVLQKQGEKIRFQAFHLFPLRHSYLL